MQEIIEFLSNTFCFAEDFNPVECAMVAGHYPEMLVRRKSIIISFLNMNLQKHILYTMKMDYKSSFVTRKNGSYKQYSLISDGNLL